MNLNTCTLLSSRILKAHVYLIHIHVRLNAQDKNPLKIDAQDLSPLKQPFKPTAQD